MHLLPFLAQQDHSSRRPSEINMAERVQLENGRKGQYSDTILTRIIRIEDLFDTIVIINILASTNDKQNIEGS